MTKYTLIACLVAKMVSSSVTYTQEALRDKVDSLPGQSTLPLSNQFSGFLDISDSKFIHYYYFEAEVADPFRRPLVFWTNGGPGCSGLLGLFTEFGPWRPQSDGSIAANPFSWSSLASLVFLEQPAGVGFSYQANQQESWNDFKAANDNILTLKAFFKRFPEQLTASGFFVASESYGGHYMPQLTILIFNDPELNARFKGMLVGNPYTSFSSGSVAMANVIWGLQLVPRPLWTSFTDSSCDNLANSVYHYSNNCWQLLNRLNDYVDGVLNEYALEFPTCTENVITKSRSGDIRSFLFSSSSQAAFQLRNHRRMEADMQKRRSMATTNETKAASLESYTPQHSKWTSTVPSKKATSSQRFSHGYDPCAEQNTVAYLNRHEVQDALHVVQPGNKYVKWDVCSDPVNNNWALSDYCGDTTALYSTLYAHPLRPKGFRILVYSGDADGVCATVGTQHWIYSIKGAEVLSLFTPWLYIDSTYGKQQAGFLTTFTEGLSFATVHHAGHEVPAYQPERALQLFQNFLDGSFFFNVSNAMGVMGDVGNRTVEKSSLDSAPAPESTAIIVVVSSVVGLLLLLVSIFCIYRFWARRAFQYKLTEDFDDSKHSSAAVEL